MNIIAIIENSPKVKSLLLRFVSNTPQNAKKALIVYTLKAFSLCAQHGRYLVGESPTGVDSANR